MKTYIIDIVATFETSSPNDARIIQSHIAGLLKGLTLHPPIRFEVSEAVEEHADAV